MLLGILHYPKTETQRPTMISVYRLKVNAVINGCLIVWIFKEAVV